MAGASLKDECFPTRLSTIEAALGAGINLLAVDFEYEASAVGQALKELKARDRVLLTAVIDFRFQPGEPLGLDRLEAEIDRMLDLLETDCLELPQIRVADWYLSDGIIYELLEELEKIQARKKILHPAFYSGDLDERILVNGLEEGWFKVVMRALSLLNPMACQKILPAAGQKQSRVHRLSSFSKRLAIRLRTGGRVDRSGNRRDRAGLGPETTGGGGLPLRGERAGGSFHQHGSSDNRLSGLLFIHGPQADHQYRGLRPLSGPDGVPRPRTWSWTGARWLITDVFPGRHLQSSRPVRRSRGSGGHEPNHDPPGSGRPGNGPVSTPGRDRSIGDRKRAAIWAWPVGAWPFWIFPRPVKCPCPAPRAVFFLVYNGEIYNYLELREELLLKGRRFTTGTDTEVIIQAFSEWGPDCFARFNGMWALALYDARERALYCCRDRFGIKPLYYYSDPELFVFASEIKALLAHPQVPCRPALEAMFNYLARSYRFVDGRPTTFFENIKQVMPGTFLKVTARGRETHTYWRLEPQTEASLTGEQDCIDRYLELLTDAVRIRLRSDVPVAAQLSGGLDSSAIAVLASLGTGPGLAVFSACYDQKPFDEREFIHKTVSQIQARATEVFPRPDHLLEKLGEMIRAFDEPVCTVTFYAHWQVVAEVKRQGYKVVLNGHGADELAGGYYDHFLHHFLDLKALGRDSYLADEIAAWLANHGDFRLAQWEDYQETAGRGVSYMTDYLKFFAGYQAALGPELAGIESEKPDFSGSPSVLTKRLASELLYETVPAVLKAEDRTTMAHSIESRLPFLDYRLVEFMFSLPNTLKIRNGLGKYIQRRALAGVLAEKVGSRREKVGFNAPSEHWFRGVLKKPLERAVENSRLFDAGFVKKNEFNLLWAEHQAGRANHYQFLWQMLNLDVWLGEYF